MSPALTPIVYVHQSQEITYLSSLNLAEGEPDLKNERFPGFSSYLEAGVLWAPGWGKNPCSEEEEEVLGYALCCWPSTMTSDYFLLWSPYLPLQVLTVRDQRGKDLWRQGCLDHGRRIRVSKVQRTCRTPWWVLTEGRWHYCVYDLQRHSASHFHLHYFHLTDLPYYPSHLRDEVTKDRREQLSCFKSYS